MQLVLQRVLDLPLQVLRDVGAVGNVSDAREGGGLRILVAEAGQPEFGVMLGGVGGLGE